MNQILRVYWYMLHISIAIHDNKQLLDEVEHDIMNYQCRGELLAEAKAKADNTDTRLMIHIISCKNQSQ